MKCLRCRQHPATSVATGLCTACLYEDEMGKERADKQRQLAQAELEREQAERRRLASQRRGVRNG